MVVGQPGLAQHVQIRLAVQVRGEVAVDPRVVGLGGHVHVLADRRGEPAHQLGLDVAVDLTLVDLDALEPAVVLFEAEQRAGVVEQNCLDVGSHPSSCQV